MGRKSMMKNERRKVKNKLNKHQKELTTDFEMMDPNTELLERLLKSKGKKEDTMHLIDEMVHTERHKDSKRMIREASLRLDDGSVALNNLLKLLLEEYADPNMFINDPHLSQEEVEAMFEEEIDGELNEESIEEYKLGWADEIFMGLNVAYTQASLAMDLLKDIGAKLNIELDVYKGIKVEFEDDSKDWSVELDPKLYAKVPSKNPKKGYIYQIR